MTTATIETTVTAMEGIVCLFETDVVVTVDYEVTGGELDWWVTSFAREECHGQWNDAKGVYEFHTIASVAIKPGHWFYQPLLVHLDSDHLEQRLIDQEQIVLVPDNADHRAAYNAGVL